MTTSLRWTSADLEVLPDDGKRYEIIDGELHVSKQPSFYHQDVCSRLVAALMDWSKQTGSGKAVFAPGIIFAGDDDVVPDVVWISNDRLATALGPDGKLHAAPELIVEVLSPGAVNERRDRKAKLKLYSQRGVSEYWIVDWQMGRVEIYCREYAHLHLTATLEKNDFLTTTLLEGFSCRLSTLFEGIPKDS